MNVVYMVLAIVATLTWQPTHPKRECLVFQDKGEYVRAWLHDGGTAASQLDVDWERSMVVAAFAGAGHRIKIDTVAIPATEMKIWDLYVLYREDGGDSDVVVVPRYRIGQVHFLAADSPEGQRILTSSRR